MKVSKKLILQEAVEIRNFTKKNKKLPKYATISNSQFSQSQYCYVLAKQISKISLPTISKITVKEPSNSNGDNVEFNMDKVDYIDLANRVTKFIEINKQAPNYAKHKNYKIKFELYTYCFSKILSFYKENNYLPNYCLFDSKDLQNTQTTTTNTKKINSTSTSNNQNTPKKTNCSNPYTSSPHPTKQGCNEMGQNTNYFCGVSAIHKILRKFGITKYSQETLSKWAGTTSAGTDHKGIETCIAKVSKETGIKLTCQWYNFSELGFEKLANIICKQDKDVLVHLNYRLKYGHYEVINQIDTKDNTLKVLNSLGNKCAKGCFCGYVENRSFSTEKQYIAGISQKSILVVTKG